MLLENFNSTGYIQRELTHTRLHAFCTFLFIVLPQMMIAFLLFCLVAPKSDGLGMNMYVFLACFIAAVIISTPIHELLHGICHAAFCEQGFKSVKFGITGINPYCRCTELLPVSRFRVGIIMPLLVTGLLPIIIAFFFNIPFLLFVGIVCYCPCASDLTTFIRLFFENPNSLVIDAPNKAGVILYELPSNVTAIS